MKKSKLSASLVTGFVAALSLCACNELTADSRHIITYKDYSSGEVSVNIDAFYESYRYTPSGLNTIYEAVVESIIRYEFQSGKMDSKTDKTLSELKDKASDKVKGKKEEAEKNKETNKTSYETEWNKILEANGCKDEAELYQHFLYDLEKAEVEDWYLKENYKRIAADKSLISEFIGVDKNGKSTQKNVAPVYPYHIRHVLASVADSGTKFSNNIITESEAKNLWTIVDTLSDDDAVFGDATKYTGDSGSKSASGDAGIMTTSTSFIEEFKLGIYAFDAIYNPSHSSKNTVIQNGLGVKKHRKGEDNLLGSKTIEDTFKQDIGLAAVPYRAFAVLGDSSDITTDASGYQVNEGNDAYYPRNIYWNLYCNLHQPFVVTDGALGQSDADLVEAGLLKQSTANGFAATFAGSKFVTAESLGLDSYLGDCKVLVDEEGRVIIGARGSYGIHFMIMRKSIYDYSEGGVDNEKASLEEYYTPFIPGDTYYPKYRNNSGELVDKTDTFVKYIYRNEDASIYNPRSDKVKEAIRGFDTTYDYRLYLDFVGDSTVTFKFNGVEDKNLGTRIADLVASKQSNNLYNREGELQQAWSTYIERIEAQNADRVEAIIEDYYATNDFRLIPEGCAIGFKKTDKGAEWGEGGYCYYAS